MAYGLTKSAHLVAASSQSLTRADNATFDITSDLTIEGWVRLASGANGFLVSKWGDSISWARAGYELRLNQSTGALTLSIAGSGSSEPSLVSTSVTGTLTADTWYHVAVVYDASAGSAAYYINGVQQGTTQTGHDTAINNNSLPFGIGCNHNGSDAPANFLSADISLVRLWAETRTEAQIADNACNVLGATTNLKGEWTLDDVVTDNSGNGNTLTNNGTVTFTTELPATCLSTAYTQDLTEVITLSATIAKQTGKVLTDAVALAETMARNTGKALTDVVTLVATIDTSYIFSELLNEFITLTDTVIKQTGKAINEVITLAENVAKATSRALTDVITLVASITINHAFTKTFNEIITITDTIAKTVGKVLTDVVTTVDTVTKRFTVKIVKETITLVASIGTIQTFFKAFTETITLTAVLTKVGAFARSFTESIALKDRLRGLLNGVNMLYNNKYTAKAVTYFKKYIDPK